MSNKLKIPPLPNETSKEQSTQAEKFRQAAKELETDNDEKRFDENLKKLAKSTPEKEKPVK